MTEFKKLTRNELKFIKGGTGGSSTTTEPDLPQTVCTDLDGNPSTTWDIVCEDKQ